MDTGHFTITTKWVSARIIPPPPPKWPLHHQTKTVAFVCVLVVLLMHWLVFLLCRIYVSLKAIVKCVMWITKTTFDTVSFVPSRGMGTAAAHARLSDHVNQLLSVMRITVPPWPSARLLAVELFQALQNWPTTLHEFLFCWSFVILFCKSAIVKIEDYWLQFLLCQLHKIILSYLIYCTWLKGHFKFCSLVLY